MNASAQNLSDGVEGESLVVLNQGNVRHNATIVNNSRVFSALVGGIVTGILGITGYRGFLVFLTFQILNASLLLLACRGQPRQYFVNPKSLLFSGIVSQTELLTFVLLWTLSNNLVYVY